MMLKRTSSQSKHSAWSLMRAGLAGLAVLVGGSALTAGCLDRPVAPAVPKTSNVYVDEIRQTAVDKIDLLFMIDNSISMADKQAILAQAVPQLVQRLVTPLCVTSCTGATCTEAEKRDGIPTDPPTYANAKGECDSGAPEFGAIRDIHVGVVTSSLGSHGATGDEDVCVTAENNDHAHLLGSVRTPELLAKTYDDTDTVNMGPFGFLKWDQTKPEKYTPAGDSDVGVFTPKFTEMVKAAGEHGCGYEASLESWYRFLIDPEPPLDVVVPMGMSTSVVQGVDPVVIAQREKFLRPDSLVAVVMLSDENDCSIQDEGYGWLIAHSSPMFRATSQCAANPNDHCCQSCAEKAARQGCPALPSDSECAKGQVLAKADDDLNLRCWQQKRRFGFDLLYKTSRYSEGLRAPLLRSRDNMKNLVNPLFAAKEGVTPRDKGLVFLAGIIGVPWQDLADEASLAPGNKGLRYLTSTELLQKDRWAMILGLPNVDTQDPPVLPTDPLMIEQAEPRTGMNPVTKEALAPPDSTDQQANHINGHEQLNLGNKDLQYACTFQLAKEVECTPAKFALDEGCDCYTDDLPYNRPLCKQAGGKATTTQSYAKAYPGLRHLQVLKEFQDNSIVASICPKDPINETTNPDYGYNPAVKAIIDRLKEALKGKCLPRPLVPAKVPGLGLVEGQVPCAVIEALPPKPGVACTCNAGENRLALDGSDGKAARPQLRDAVLNKLRQGQSCGTTADNPCESYCTCELAQLAGQNLTDCQNKSVAPQIPGYCYVNAAPNEEHIGNADLVKDCSPDSKRLLRFVGETPAPNAIALVACLGASLGSQ